MYELSSYVTRDLGITFKKSESGKWRDIDERGNYRNELETYVEETSKSATESVIRFNRAAIDWQSKMQSLVAQSTSEAEEPYAACESSQANYLREMFWLMN